MAVQIQMRRGTAAEWTAANPTLSVGEIGVETDTGNFKIGDGSTNWNARAYSLSLSNSTPQPVGTAAAGTAVAASRADHVHAGDGAGLDAPQIYYGYDATQFGPESITPAPEDGTFAVGVDPASDWYDVYQRIDGTWVDTDPDNNQIQEALIRNAAREETTNLGLDALVDFYGAPITEISVLTTIFQTAFTAGQAQAFLDVSKGELIISIAANTSDTATLLSLFTPGYPIRGNVAIAGNWDGYVTNAFSGGGTWGTGVVVYLRLFDDTSVNNVSNAMDVPDAATPQVWFVNGSSTGALFNGGVFGATDVSNRFLVKNNENTRWVAGPVMEDFVVDDNSTTSTAWDAQAQQIVVSVNQNLLNDIDADIALKAPLASPALTGTPTAPTAAQGTNTTQVATTAFVNAEIGAIAVPKNTLSAKGALITASAANTPTGITVGSDGQVLQADSTKPAGLTWSTPLRVYRQTLTGSGVEGQSFTVTHNLGVEAVTMTLWDTASHTVTNVFDATAWEVTSSTTSGFTLTPATTIPDGYTYVLTIIG